MPTPQEDWEVREGLLAERGLVRSRTQRPSPAGGRPHPNPSRFGTLRGGWLAGFGALLALLAFGLPEPRRGAAEGPSGATPPGGSATAPGAGVVEEPERSSIEKPPSRDPEAELPAPSSQPRTESLLGSLDPKAFAYLEPAGMPAGRTGSGTRSARDGPRPVVLVPETVGLTLEAQPTLYWFLDEPSAEGVEITVDELPGSRTLLRTRSAKPLSAGVHGLRLADHGVQLRPDRPYRFLVRAHDGAASGGLVQRSTSPRVPVSLPAEERLQRLAAAGIWFDALDLLSRSIERRPAASDLHAARARLLEQGGLDRAAAWDRAAAQRAVLGVE